MLFSKDIEPHCAYCEHAVYLRDDKVMCLKKGVMPAVGSCRKFRYDPLKRVPPKPQPMPDSKFSEEDFSL
jgi:hypothetical protein